MVDPLFVSNKLNKLPLHTVCVCGPTTGLALTDTTNWNGAPSHDPAAPDLGVIW